MWADLKKAAPFVLLTALTFLFVSETFQEWFSNAASEQEKLLQIKRILGKKDKRDN